MQSGVDLFVVGGGPAGLVAAIAACQQGLSVTVADGADHPIDKPCGEGLPPETQEALAKLNIHIPSSEGFRFRGIRFLQNGAQVCAEYSHGMGIGIRRTLLHELLVTRAEQAGVKLLWKAPVTAIDENGVRLKSGFVPARWIVGADGGGSRVRRWAGLEETVHQHQRFANRRHYRVNPWTDCMEIYWGPRAQGYVTPISKDEVCVVVMAECAQDANFVVALQTFPELRNRLRSAELASRERGAISSMHRLKNVSRGKVVLVGDSSGSVDAITGEGLRVAFAQAAALAACLKNGNLQNYRRRHRQIANRPDWLGKLLVTLGRHSTFRQRALRSLAANPELFGEFLEMHSGYLTAPAIIATGAKVVWEFLAA
jgi:flavin-dependent dehydrogenase